MSYVRQEPFLEPPATYLPPAPDGFVMFPRAPLSVKYNAEAWGIPPERLRALMNLRAFEEVIGRELAAGRGRAAGIHRYKGILMWAPRETWRTSGRHKGKQESATFLALHGQSIDFPFPLVWGLFNCYPILSFRTLALMFNATNPPGEPPQSVLDSIREVQSEDWDAPQTPAKATKPAKKPPVPLAALQRWFAIYRAQFPDPDKRPDADAQCEAARAHFKDNAPVGEKNMKELRADPSTPPEWREAGRRPKSI